MTGSVGRLLGKETNGGSNRARANSISQISEQPINNALAVKFHAGRY